MEPLAPRGLAQELGLLFIISISLPQCFTLYAQPSTVTLGRATQVSHTIQSSIEPKVIAKGDTIHLLYPARRVILPAQPAFEVPLTVTDGPNTQTVYIGIVPGANRCMIGDCFGTRCEAELPPAPPTGVFDGRLLSPAGCANHGGSLSDFRNFSSPTQLDTFRVRAQLGAGTTMTLCWPAGLSVYFTELTICGINALIDTCFTWPFGDATLCTILSGGLVVSVDKGPEGTLPEDFILYQNYPNPFNPSTEIRFRIAVSGFTTLKAYDVLGCEVATLVEGEQEAGEHQVQWKPEGVSTGVYMYRLAAPGATIAKKMLLLR